MAVAAVVVFAAMLAGNSRPGQRWIVAARTLGPGTVLEAGDLTSSTMRLPGATAALAYRQAALVEGRTLAVGLRPGELLQASVLVPSSQEPVLRPVSLAVDPVSLAGLSAGQPVDVLMTQGTGGTGTGGAAGTGGTGTGGTGTGGTGTGGTGTGGTGAGVTVVVRGATLLDVVTSNSSSLTAGSGGQVTIGVSTLSEVEDLVAAAHTGTVTLVAAEPSDGAGPGPGPAAP